MILSTATIKKGSILGFWKNKFAPLYLFICSEIINFLREIVKEKEKSAWNGGGKGR